MSDRKIERTFVREIPTPAKMATYFCKARAHAEIGFVQLGMQDPYFHALAGVEGQLRNGRWEGDLGRFACCADHEALRKHFPKYARLVRWHLCSITTGLMHYEANAIYWAEGVRTGPPGARDAAIQHFRSTTCFGALDTDGGEPWLLPEDQLRSWLSIRPPALMAAFRADIDATFPGMWEAALALVVKEH